MLAADRLDVDLFLAKRADSLMIRAQRRDGGLAVLAANRRRVDLFQAKRTLPQFGFAIGHSKPPASAEMNDRPEHSTARWPILRQLLLGSDSTYLGVPVPWSTAPLRTTRRSSTYIHLAGSVVDVRTAIDKEGPCCSQHVVTGRCSRARRRSPGSVR